MRALVLVALVVARPHGGGCNGPAEDGRIGVVGHASACGSGVIVDEIGVGTPADGAIEPGEEIVAVDGVALVGPDAWDELVDHARGVPGTPVDLEIVGPDGARWVRLERARISDDAARRRRAQRTAH